MLGPGTDPKPSPLEGEGRAGGGPNNHRVRRILSTPALPFAAGVLLVMAPWFIKNVVDTGNPVYPLGYRVFGGRDWDEAREAQWSNAHGRKPITTKALVDGLLDVAGKSDWLAPGLVALAPLAFLRPGSRRVAGLLWAYVVYLFATWWLFTHRIDRFWLPLLPSLAVLAGLGADWTRDRAWTALVGLVLAVSIASSAAHSTTNFVALNDWTGDLVKLRSEVPAMVNPPLARLDAVLPPDAKPLLVGQAQTFHMNHPVVYNTVFDRDIFESIDRDRSPGEVRDELDRRGITHIYVDWSEVARYRSPGNYGFTDYVTPDRFDRLVRAGVLSRPVAIGAEQVLYTRSCRRGSPTIRGVRRGWWAVPTLRRERGMDAPTIVTGGAGFIGSHLVRRLVERGERVRVVERPGADAGHLPDGVEIVRADIRDREAVEQAMRGARVVYHLAANPNLWVRDRRDFEAVNHQGTIHVLDAARDAGAERILHTSTESILTCARGTGPIAEDVEVGLDDAVGPYCRSKLEAENEAMARARSGWPVVVANPTMPVGPGDRGMSPPSRLIRDFCLGKLPARMDCTLNLIDVRDVAEGLIRTMERGRPGRRYLLGGENLTLVGLLGLLSDLTGVPVPRWSVPYPVGLAVAYASEWLADHVTGRTPKATVTGVRLTRRTMHFDASRSLADLGLEPRPVAESLADAVAWLRETGQIPASVRPGYSRRSLRTPGGHADHPRSRPSSKTVRMAYPTKSTRLAED